MSCLVHLDANGKATNTNRQCKFINDLKEDPDSGYKQSRKNRPRGKGKGKNKEEESKDSSDMDEDVDPKHAAKSDDKGKNPFEKKGTVFHTFLGTPTIRQQKTSMRILMATLPPVPALVGDSNYLGREGSPRPHPYEEPICHGHQPID